MLGGAGFMLGRARIYRRAGFIPGGAGFVWKDGIYACLETCCVSTNT